MELDTFLTVAEDLLAVESTALRLDQLHRAVDQVLDFVGPGFRVERFESNGKPSALVHAERSGISGRPEFRVILNGHLDVVPGEPEQFRPRRAGGRLYARGAQDMKLSALVQAQVFRELAASLPYPLALQLVTDEEVGGNDGTRYQLQQGVTGAFVIIGEYSGLKVVADSKGHAHVRLLATGRAGHGAYPWQGDNAVLKLVATMNRVAAAYPLPAGEIWRTTVNFARIETPNRALNQIPAAAEAWLDIRFPGEDTDFFGRTTAEVAEHMQSFCEPGVEAVADRLDAPQRTDHDLPEVVRLRQAARNQGYSADFIYKHGSSDAGFYSERGIPPVAFGIGGSGQHGPEEYAEIATIVPYYNALREFLQELDAERDE